MNIVLRNTLTGKFFANGAWNVDSESAQEIEKNSPEHIFLRHVWEMTYVEEVAVAAAPQTKSIEDIIPLSEQRSDIYHLAKCLLADGKERTTAEIARALKLNSYWKRRLVSILRLTGVNSRKVGKAGHKILRWSVGQPTDACEEAGTAARQAKGRELLAKADRMRRNASLNTATNSRNAKVARMMIGRADALEVKARALLDS